MGDGADKMTGGDASKHLGGREGKQQTMKTNTKQGAAYTTWARFVPCVLLPGPFPWLFVYASP